MTEGELNKFQDLNIKNALLLSEEPSKMCKDSYGICTYNNTTFFCGKISAFINKKHRIVLNLYTIYIY